MKIAITSIQRDRNPYVVEWLAFHLMVGFNQFYIYCHKTRDGMDETLLRLSQHYPIQLFKIEQDERPQIVAYQHAWANFGAKVDWMAFIDGDEFLFPTHAASMQEALSPYRDAALSALGVYWKCYGSNGRIAEPPGLLLENFPRHSATDFGPNRHIKSIVKGGSLVNPCRAHLFDTDKGTFDEHLRPINHGHMADYLPTYDHFRINHYVVQSSDYYFRIKHRMDAADMPQGLRRNETFFEWHDRNEEDDGVAGGFLPALKLKVAEMNRLLQPQATTATAAAAATPGPQIIVKDYQLLQPIPPSDFHFNRNSVGLKEIVGHIFQDPSRSVSVLDIGIGQGELGRTIRTQPHLSHWQTDGIDGSLDTFCNASLFDHGYYRNIWHGLAQELPAAALRTYDLICLFDGIAHLEPLQAKKLLSDLLHALGPDSRLVLGAPLCFFPAQAHRNGGDVKQQEIAIPAQSLIALSPTMIYVDPKSLVGTFVFTRQSIPLLDKFVVTADRGFNFDAGLQNLQALGMKADGVLYFTR